MFWSFTKSAKSFPLHMGSPPPPPLLRAVLPSLAMIMWWRRCSSVGSSLWRLTSSSSLWGPTSSRCTPAWSRKRDGHIASNRSSLQPFSDLVECPFMDPWTHCNENPIYVFISWELRGLSPNFQIHVSVSDLYISRIGPHIFCSWKGRSIVGIYKSLTDTWMCKLGLWPRNSFSGNIRLKFLVLVLCRA